MSSHIRWLYTFLWMKPLTFAVVMLKFNIVWFLIHFHFHMFYLFVTFRDVNFYSFFFSSFLFFLGLVLSSPIFIFMFTNSYRRFNKCTKRKKKQGKKKENVNNFILTGAFLISFFFLPPNNHQGKEDVKNRERENRYCRFNSMKGYIILEEEEGGREEMKWKHGTWKLK